MTELDFIARDIDCSLHSHFGSDWKNVIKEELFIKNNPRIAKLNGNKRFFKSWVYDVLERHLSSPGSEVIVSKKADYIYLLYEAILFSGERRFYYKVYDYCETRIRDKSSDRKFWYVCIKSVHPKTESLHYDAERLVLEKVFFSEPPEEINVIDANRMKDILKEAELALSKKYEGERVLESIKTYVQMLIVEIDRRFELPYYKMFDLE